MACVLYIGFYEKGKFNNDNWKIAKHWLVANCNNIIVYLTNNSKDFSCAMLNGFIFEEEAVKESDSFKLRIWYEDDKILPYLSELQFSIDTGVSYLYFLKDDSCIAELQVVDFENFVVMNISEEHEKILGNMISNKHENETMCYLHRDDIKTILDDQQWHPLTAQNKKNL